ncbi:YdaU family protein [Stutzerimonas stutzeri]
MHYFKRNIGDYHKKAGRLSMLEHGAYTLLMDACYDRECFPTMDEAIDWCWARSDEEIAAVKFVLTKFFTLEGEQYTQQRIADEIESFHEKSDKNKQIALDREAKRRAKRAPGEHETCTNGHLTTNQEPLTSNQEEQEQKALVPSADDTSAYSAEFEAFWAEYPKREGGNSKKGAHKAWNARLRSGVKAEDLILSAKRYADQMQAKGNVGTSFVKQAATFLGPDEHWREALASNIHPLRTTAAGGVVKGDSRTCPPLTRKGDFEYWNAIENRWEVRNTETHDPATGYAWSYLKSRGQA